MKNIGIYLDLKINKSIDFTNVMEGNPGVGGTPYLQALIATYLSINNNFESVTLYVNDTHSFESSLNRVIVDDEFDAIKKANKDNIDIFIFAVRNFTNLFFELLDYYNLNSIAWVHNYLSYSVLDYLYHSKSVKRVVFVGQQHYDCYIDDKIIKKSTYIYNVVPINNNFVRNINNKEKIVTYVGALDKSKGFDLLAKEWKRITKKIPEAQLHVIGSGKLYNHSLEMGSYGLAESKFERKFIKHLINNQGEILDNVKFFGSLGSEKETILKNTTVGVANPTGKTETFCLSAVEFQSLGIPVVSYKGYGLLDTILENTTGKLSKNGRKLSKNIIFFLENNNENVEYGKRGKIFSNEKFSPNVIIPQWENTINSVLDNQSPANVFSYSSYADDFKWLKYLNYHLNKKLQFFNTPSIAYTVSFTKKIIKKLLYM